MCWSTDTRAEAEHTARKRILGREGACVVLGWLSKRRREPVSWFYREGKDNYGPHDSAPDLKAERSLDELLTLMAPRGAQ
jgi:hypothetical protein